MMISRHFGAEKIIVSDVADGNRLNLALSLGADIVVNGSKGDIGEQLMAHIGRDKVDGDHLKRSASRLPHSSRSTI